VKLIGLKVISALLAASGVQKIMDSRYKKFEDVWKDSNKAAFYANKISIQTNKTRYSEFIYLAALIGDIGRIVLLSIKPELIKRIYEIAGIKVIENIGLLEEMNLGISHSTLGSLICEKWNFNELLITIIKYHHRPYFAPNKYKELIYIVYIAYSLIDIENKKAKFEFLDEDILEYYNLNNRDTFETLHRTLKSTYETHYRES
jgi:HD-like signal output (HDOD) protein